MKFLKMLLLFSSLVLVGFGCQNTPPPRTQNTPKIPTNIEMEQQKSDSNPLVVQISQDHQVVSSTPPLVIGEFFSPTDTSFSSQPFSKVLDFSLHQEFQSNKKTYTLSYVPLTFQLSDTYGFTEHIGFEGGFGSSIYFGKRVNNNQFRSGLLSMELATSLPDYFLQADAPTLTPEDTIKALRDSYSQRGMMVAYRVDDFFGNPGIVSAAGDGFGFVGFITSTQLSKDILGPDEVLYVRISYGTYGTGLKDDYNLFQELISSIRLK